MVLLQISAFLSEGTVLFLLVDYVICIKQYVEGSITFSYTSFEFHFQFPQRVVRYHIALCSVVWFLLLIIAICFTMDNFDFDRDVPGKEHAIRTSQPKILCVRPRNDTVYCHFMRNKINGGATNFRDLMPCVLRSGTCLETVSLRFK